jgi:two-component system cell cycle response regulator
MSGRILVVDDQPVNIRVLEAMLQAEYFDVCTAANGYQAIDVAKLEQPDLILLDVMMPGMDGFETCRRLKADAATRHIPVVMVTALDQRDDRIKGLEAGADDFLTKPVHDLTLFARVRSLLRLKLVLDELRYREENGVAAGMLPDHGEDDHGDQTALIVAGEQWAAERYLAAMPANVATSLITDPADAAAAITAGVDIVVVDLTSSDFDGLRLCARVRADPATRQLPILAVVNPDDVAGSVKALDLGVNDIVHRPVDAGELNARIQTQLRRKLYAEKLRDRLDEGLEMAVIDPLTGLHNRRYIASRLRQAVESAQSGGAPVSLMLADIDHFKAVNDTHGHEAGDRVLKEFSKRLSDGLRALDMAARYGGEEFLIVMPGAGLAEAGIGAERLRGRIADTPFEHAEGQCLDITVSIGIAQVTAGESMEALLRRVDAALYDAKSDGRNRVGAAANTAA